MTAALSLLGGLSDNITIDPLKCTFCGICVERCILDNLRLKLAPCRRECPLHTNCQGYVQLIARGDDKKAMSVLAEVLPFVGIIGRVCHHPCESACTRREVDGEAVAIRDLKRYLADHVDLPPVVVSPERQQSVGIVGAGPAGAMAAFCLRKQGFQVEVYDANQRAGGMLAVGVPEFRLPVNVLDAEMGVLSNMGVAVHLGVRVGADLPLARLLETHDAVLLATGVHVSQRLGVEGEDLSGVQGGLEFLSAARGTNKPTVGRRVIVIGGGNTAVDVAQTARRLGAEDVSLVCLEAPAEMPAFAWEVEDARDEGVQFVNRWGPVRFVASDGSVSAVELRRCVAVFDGEGRFAPSYNEAERLTVDADTVVVAIGQRTDLSFVGELPIPVAGGRIMAAADTLQCQDGASQASLSKVFAAGDVVTGPKTVVDALASGREAAESIRRFLDGDDLRYGRSYLGPCDLEFEVDKSKALPRRRTAMPKTDLTDRRSFSQLEKGFSAQQARKEAERCLSCGLPYGKFRTCWFCLPCEVDCPEEALHVEIPYLLR